MVKFMETPARDEYPVSDKMWFSVRCFFCRWNTSVVAQQVHTEPLVNASQLFLVC